MNQFPESTYRLQFHAAFTFRDAAAIVPYLASLGVTHVYASPYLKARPGSTHGYDVIDHCSLNPELGTEADYRAWIGTMREHGLSHILDIVPNHVGINTNHNKWWNDVLENGPGSKFANYFDISWRDSPRPALHDKVLLPVLGEMYGDVLDKGELKLVRENDKVFVAYYDRRFPIDPRTAPVDLNLSTDELHALLEQQHYRLAYWRVAADEINYRRFFDINDLAALSMERADVFEATHQLILKLVNDSAVCGLRVDHPDGLYDPRQYFDRLQEKQPGVYVVAEKILAFGEPLPSDWKVQGTTGYDFLNMVNGLFVDPAGEEAFTKLYKQWNDQPFNELVYEKKRLILETSLSSELHRLAHQLDRIAQADRHTRDFTFNGLLVAIREIVACFDVYRTYMSETGVSETDRARIESAVRAAIERNPRHPRQTFQFVRDTLLRNPRFAGRFQQLTAPVTAKGIEDTAFYVYNRFVSLNEVGGDPSRFGISPRQLHDYFIDRRKNGPYALSALSTHDTKRSEDVRARLNVLSEIPDEWSAAVQRWMKLNDQGDNAPDRNDEYLLYQTLIGVWGGDDLLKRVQAYMLKAIREAKTHTSWTDPNAAYESAVTQFIERIVRDRDFVDGFEPFQRRVAEFGVINSLSQTLLRLTAPGVPDTYQGCELMDFSLVDPDNRRPVDYTRRREMLAERSSAARDPDAMKLRVTNKALAARRAHPGLFSEGEYEPVATSGSLRQCVFAFIRRHRDAVALVVVPRLVTQTKQADPWRDTHLELPAALPKQMTDLLTDERYEPVPRDVGTILQGFPVALLIGRG